MGKKTKDYYAVKVGFVPGIFTDWRECQQSINGYSGAVYKGFDTKEEAEAFLNEIITEEVKEIPRLYSDSDAIAYVAGSFNASTSEYAYGVLLFYDGGEEHFSAKFNEPDLTQMKDLAGEIEGAKCAMRFCKENGIKSLDLFYVCDGIKNWCTGAWATKKIVTKEYKQFYNSIKDLVTVNFIKTKANLCGPYKELADSLAKAALGIKTVTGVSDRSNGAVATGINQSDLDSILELLGEDYPDITKRENEIPYGLRYELRIDKPNKQKLFIQFYEKKNKIWIYGRKEDLYNSFTTYVVELLDTDKIPDFLNSVHNLSVDKDIVETEFMKLFPHSHDKLPKDICRYLHQAVYNLQIDGDVYAANFLVEPAIRPLEGILKVALQSNGLPIRQEDKDYDSFFVFKEKEYGYIIKEQYYSDTMKKDMEKYLCKCYMFYRENRHTLFHWDNPCEKIDSTRILNTTAEAQVIIRDAISLIDEYYSL